MVETFSHILFYKETAPFRLCRIDQQGAVLEEVQYQQFAEIALTESDKLLVLLPGQHCVAAAVYLPGVNRSEWANVIPYELENQLILDSSEYFFALGERDAANNVPVVVVAKDYFETVLETISSSGLTPAAITPYFLALPRKANTWVVYCRTEFIVVRTALENGFTTDLPNLHQMIELSDPQPEKLEVMGKDTLGLDLHIPIEHSELRFDPAIKINLLQGDYQRKSTRFQIRPRWRLSFYGCIAVVVSLLISYGGQYFYFSYHKRQLQQQVTTVYQQLFPKQSVPADSSAQVNALHDHLVKVVGSNDFMRMLKLFGYSLKRYSKIDLISSNYNQPNMQVRIKAEKLTEINQFILALSKSGLSVQQTQKLVGHHVVIVELNISEAKS